jgi:hypothetical protein
MERSESLTNLAAALVAAQAKLTNPGFDSENPHFHSAFVSLAGVRNHVAPVLAAYGLAVVQLPGLDGSEPVCRTMLLHTSGEYIVGTYPLRPAKPDPQGLGAAYTYARRYSLLSMLGIVGDEDDDGNAASGGNGAPVKRAPSVAPAGGLVCPKCGAQMVKRKAKNGGEFMGCKGYPDCRYTCEILETAGAVPTEAQSGGQDGPPIRDAGSTAQEPAAGKAPTGQTNNPAAAPSTALDPDDDFSVRIGEKGAQALAAKVRDFCKGRKGYNFMDMLAALKKTYGVENGAELTAAQAEEYEAWLAEEGKRAL